MDWVPLSGRWVRLVPLDESHREPLRRAAADERIWTFTLSRGCGAGFDPWFDEALAERAAGRRVPFAVGRVADGEWVGSTSYLDVATRHRRVEIGSTWYHPTAWGTAVNPECKLLLLAHAFEVGGVNRVALVTDALNVRSQAAIAKLGAEREGVLRSHMVTQGGRVRDSVVFGIVAADWPAVRDKLLARLAATAEPAAAAPPDLAAAHLRIARPTDDLAAVVRFYRDGLGFDVLAEFRDHAGFDGVMLGRAGAAYHLEFTRKAGHPVGRAPTDDNLLVFYLPDAAAWAAAVARLEAAGHPAVPAFNPYWDRHGKTFADPDGYRVVLQNAAWPG